MKNILLFICLACFFMEPVFGQQGTNLTISDIKVQSNGQIMEGKSFHFPFIYGKWSPKQEIFNAEGTIVSAAFKLVSPRSGRSEVKNSSVEFFVAYTVIHAGERRDKKAEHIYYLDAARSFESQETFSFKPNRYDIKIVKLNFKAALGE
jgi:hypothetical protein